MSKRDFQAQLLPLFERRRTEHGTRTIEDQIDQLYTGPAAGKYGWMPAIIYLLTRQYDKALSEAQRYLTTIEEIRGNNAEEMACGLLILKLIYTHLKRSEEAASLDEKFESIRNSIGDIPIHQIVTEALYEMAADYQRQDDPRSNQRAFVMACVTLALSVLMYERHLPMDLMTRLFLLFQSFGFTQNQWGWLTRRCDFRSTDFVGLISVLIDEGMFPSEATEARDLYESDSNDDQPSNEFEISRMKEQSWMTPAFSEGFLLSLAAGELSMRAELLLEEAGRWLRDLGGLSALVILFSSHSSGNHITVLEQDTSSEEKMAIFNTILGRRLAEYGADSVMALSFTTFRIQNRGTSLTPTLDSYNEEEISVEARDSKSYISGIQRIHRTPGRYELEDPVLSDTTDGCFSKFTFPVKPRTVKEPTQTAPERQ